MVGLCFCWSLHIKKSKTTAAAISRIPISPRWPVKEDYQLGGELFGVSIPYCLPLPSKRVKFIYGTSNQINQSRVEWLRVITRLNNGNGWNIYFCDCCDYIKLKQQEEEEKENHPQVKKSAIPMQPFDFHNMSM